MFANMAHKDMNNTEIAITHYLIHIEMYFTCVCVLACMCCPPNNKRGDV